MLNALASRLYGSVIALRNHGYDAGWLRSAVLPVPVISVGNITAGGTGKTPVVELLVGHLISLGLRPAVVSRGYKRESSGSMVVSDGKGNVVDAARGGDEPVQIATKFPNIVVIADARRSRGCRRAVEEFQADLIVLDDAYQHRAVARSVDIVVLDASSGLYAQRLLPEGRLREPLRNLSRADILLLSRCEADVAHEQMALALRAYSSVPVFATRFVPHVIRRLYDGVESEPGALRGKSVVSFCGVGAPASFLRTMKNMGIVPHSHEDFPDHHRFTTADAARLRGRAVAARCALFTTEKDATRLRELEAELSGVDVLYPVMRVEFLGGEKQFFSLVERGAGLSRR